MFALDVQKCFSWGLREAAEAAGAKLKIISGNYLKDREEKAVKAETI